MEKRVNKEELLSMLTEIYDQLEELEQTLEENFSDRRQSLIEEQMSKVSNCETKIVKFENSLNSKTKAAPKPLRREIGQSIFA